MISFVENKTIDWGFVRKTLKKSADSHQWSNFGPVSKILENRMVDILNLNEDKTVISCSSGTSALFALVEMHNHLSGKDLRWIVSSFNFHCGKQGPLKNAQVIDCDSDGMIDLNLIDDNEYDAILITNPFGITNSLKKYIKKNKVIICDSASAFDALPNHEIDEVISFHHTKPWGFGEGGCAIIDKKHQSLFNSIINFGVFQNKNLKLRAFNGKLSDISSAFILQRLMKIDQIKNNQIKQYNRITSIAKKLNINTLIARQVTHIPHCVPLLYDAPTNVIENSHIKLHKYYKPLEDTTKAAAIYKRIICVPCHQEIDALSDSMLKSIL